MIPFKFTIQNRQINTQKVTVMANAKERYKWVVTANNHEIFFRADKKWKIVSDSSSIKLKTTLMYTSRYNY